MAWNKMLAAMGDMGFSFVSDCALAGYKIKLNSPYGLPLAKRAKIKSELSCRFALANLMAPANVTADVAGGNGRIDGTSEYDRGNGRSLWGGERCGRAGTVQDTRANGGGAFYGDCSGDALRVVEPVFNPLTAAVTVIFPNVPLALTNAMHWP